MAWLTPFNDLLTGKDLKYAALQHALLSDQAWIRRVLDICANTAIVSSFSPNGGAPCTSHTASQTSSRIHCKQNRDDCRGHKTPISNDEQEDDMLA